MTAPVAPLRIDTPLRRGAPFRERLYVKTSSGAAQDISGATFTATVRTGEAKDATTIYSLTQTVASYVGGAIDFSLTPTQTLALVTGLEYWVSIWVSGTFTGSEDRLELHGRLDLVG